MRNSILEIRKTMCEVEVAVWTVSSTYTVANIANKRVSSVVHSYLADIMTCVILNTPSQMSMLTIGR